MNGRTYPFTTTHLNPRDGDPQFRKDFNLGMGLSGRATVGCIETTYPRTFTASLGSKNDRIKWVGDQNGSGLVWEHTIRHNNYVSSYVEAGVRNNNGKPSGVLAWVLGFR